MLTNRFNSCLQWSLKKRCMLVLSAPRRSESNNTAIKQSKSSEESSDGFGKWLLLVFPVGGLVLGTWQVKRKAWKTKLISDLQEKSTCDPVLFPQNLEDLKKLEYRPLKVHGAFDHSKELYVEPRSLISKTDKTNVDTGSLLSQKSNIGAQVITPFYLPDQKLAIMVNRGFVTRENKQPSKRMKGQVEGLIDIVGILRHTEKRPPLSPKNNPHRGVWVYKDLDEMASVTGTSPILLDAVSSIPGGPIGGQTKVTLRDEHVAYAITWYGLSLATSIMWYFRFIK